MHVNRRVRLTAAVAVAAWAWFGAASLQAGERPAGKPAYQSQFQDRVGTEWSHNKTDKTPRGERQFLGQFGNDEVALTLKDLPAHRYVRASFDLFIIRSWDGTNDHLRECGPDVWGLKVAGGPVLIRSTFSSDHVMRCDQQTFPDLYPGPAHPKCTGASAVGSLGYQMELSVGDAVYKVSVLFPHAEANLSLLFSATNLEPLDNESWGLDDVKVELVTSQPVLGADRLRDLWQSLAARDPMKASEAMWELVGGGDETSDYLGTRLSRTVEANAHEVGRLATELDDNEWRKRDAATQQLLQMGPAIIPLLQQIRDRNVSSEVLARIHWILEEMKKQDPPEASLRRHLRVVHLLDVIGTPKARRLLAEYGREGGPCAATQPASAAGEANLAAGVEAILARARGHLRDLQFDEASLLCVRAVALAKSARSNAETDALALLSRVIGMQYAYGEFVPLEERFKSGDASREVRAGLLSALLGNLDSPKRAAAFVGPDLNPEWAEFVEQATGEPNRLTAAQSLRLANWYRAMSPHYGAVGMRNTLDRAKAYYENCLRLSDKPDLSAAEGLKDVLDKIEALGHFPPRPLLRTAGS